MTFKEYKDRLSEFKIEDDAIFTCEEIREGAVASELDMELIMPLNGDFEGVAVFDV